MSSGKTASQYEIGSKIKWLGGRATAPVKKDGVVVEVVRPNRRPKTSSSSSHSGTYKVETYVARDNSSHAYWVSPEAVINTSRKPAYKSAATPKKASLKKEVSKAKLSDTVKKISPKASPESSGRPPAKQAQLLKLTTPAKGSTNGTQAASTNGKVAPAKIETGTEFVEDRQVKKGPMPDAFRRQFPDLMRYFRPARAASV